MSNRLSLRKTIFEDNNGSKSYGWIISDSYHQCYNSNYQDSSDVPNDPLDFLGLVCIETVNEDYEMLRHVLEEELGMEINGKWYDYEELKDVLTEGLLGE